MIWVPWKVLRSDPRWLCACVRVRARACACEVCAMKKKKGEVRKNTKPFRRSVKCQKRNKMMADKRDEGWTENRWKHKAKLVGGKLLHYSNPDRWFPFHLHQSEPTRKNEGVCICVSCVCVCRFCWQERKRTRKKKGCLLLPVLRAYN